MADLKVTALTADTSVDSADLGLTIEDPSGTPVSKKATWLNILKGAALGVLTSDNDIFARVSSALTRIPVGASTIVGRKASGNVTAMSVAEVNDLLGGMLVAPVTYRAGSDTSFTTTSATLADADATNLIITFTVPANGKVKIVLCGAGANSVANDWFWGLREGSTDIDQALIGAGTTGYTRTREFIITGLTPGASKSYKWAHRRLTSGTLNLYSGPTYGHLTMEAWATP